jgi:outer membrane protein TolC
VRPAAGAVSVTPPGAGRVVRPAAGAIQATGTPAAGAPATVAVTGAPALGSEETIDLGVALRLAGVSNPTIGLAQELVREALAGQLAARSLLLPTLNIGGNYHHHNGTLQASFGGIRQVDSQSLFFGFGARTLAAESVAFPGIRLFAHLGDAVFEPLAARQEVRLRQFDSQAVENAVLLDVAAAYLELIGAEARLAVLRRGETDLAEIVRVMEAYVKAGKGNPADARRAEANAELLLREIRQGEEDRAVASARLCRLLSLDPSVGLRTPGGPVELIRMTPEDADPEALVAGALRARPEVFARAAQILEAQTRIRQERVRPWVPIVSVGLSAGGFGGGGSLATSNFGRISGRTDFDAFAVWNIQNLGFGNRARVNQADAVYGQAVAEYDRVVNQVRREVIEASTEARAAARQVEMARRSVADAEEGFRLEGERIRGGFGRPLEALDTLRQLVGSRQELVRAIVAYDIAQFRLFVALGSNPLNGPPSAPAPVPAPAPAPAPMPVPVPPP